MPAILEATDFEQWERGDAKDAAALMKPAAGAGALRMDHYQVLVPDVLSTAKFYRVLGFRISDYLYVESAQRVFVCSPPREFIS